jgi:NAD-dependent dihydropyrimidine dehydrogenase PreA subunit
MYIDDDACFNCTRCMLTCPVGAIYVDRSIKHVAIDQELCVDCGGCYRSGYCEDGALVLPSLVGLRTIRAELAHILTERYQGDFRKKVMRAIQR